MSYISLSSNRHMYFLNFFGCMVRLGTEKNIFSSSTVRSSDAPIPYIALEIWEFPCFFWQLPSARQEITLLFQPLAASALSFFVLFFVVLLCLLRVVRMCQEE